MKIECTIGVVVTSCSDSSKLKKIHVPDSGDMREHFGMLLDSRAYSDITFSVRGHKFHAHKLVLAARSKLFLTEFVNGREKDEHGHILVNDIEPRVFKVTTHCLKYIKLHINIIFFFQIHIHHLYLEEVFQKLKLFKSYLNMYGMS